MTTQSHRTLRLIAIFKLLKAAGLLLVACAAFGFVHTPYLDELADWVAQLPIQNGHGYLVRAMDALLELGPRKLLAIGAATCLYASLFAIEGWGLWRGKRWAEYLTVIATASLIPLELWEIFHHFTWLKVTVLAINIGIVVYLLVLLREKNK